MGLLDKLSRLDSNSSDPPPSYNESVSTGATRLSERSLRPKQSTMKPIVTLDETSSRPQHLQKPIAIPATHNALGSPFLRAYPPALTPFNIDKDEFLGFLDTLNRVAVKSPPLNVIGLAGTVLSFVPVHNINLIGMGIDWGSKLVGHVISKGRTELLLRQANRNMFGPRGLKIEIAQLDGLAKIAGIPVLDAEGKVIKKASLLEPLGEAGEDSRDGVERLDVQERRLKTLEPYIASLQTEELPDVGKRSNWLSQWSVKDSEGLRKKGEKRMLKGRAKQDRRLEKRTAKAERKREKRVAKIEKKFGPAGLPEDIDATEAGNGLQQRISGGFEAERRIQRVDDKYARRMDKVEGKAQHSKREEKAFRKVLWVIIREYDADSGRGDNPDIGSDFDVEDSTGESSSDDVSSLEEEVQEMKIGRE